MQINPVRNDKFPAGDRGRWAIPKNPLGVHLLFITTCCGSAHPWVVFYFQTLLEGARARPQRPHFALPCCQLSSTSSHECACCNCHAQLRRAPSDQQQPVCPTAFGRRCNPRLCELYRPRDERFARVGKTSAPLTVALAIPSKQINQPHPARPAHDCVRGARPGAVAPHDAAFADRLGNRLSKERRARCERFLGAAPSQVDRTIVRCKVAALCLAG